MTNTEAVSKSRPLFGGVILLYFIIALELIMTSPFAAFFYTALNPVLLFLARWPSIRQARVRSRALGSGRGTGIRTDCRRSRSERISANSGARRSESRCRA
jgi:hypothetical protein